MDKDFIMNRLFEHMNDVGNKKNYLYCSSR